MGFPGFIRVLELDVVYVSLGFEGLRILKGTLGLAASWMWFRGFQSLGLRVVLRVCRVGREVGVV